jgi:hypothetical protein
MFEVSHPSAKSAEGWGMEDFLAPVNLVGRLLFDELKGAGAAINPEAFVAGA